MLKAVFKRHPQLGMREVCPVRTFCEQEGFFRCGCSHFLVLYKKLRIFQNLRCIRMDKGGEPVWTRELIFRDFVGTSFMDSHLHKITRNRSIGTIKANSYQSCFGNSSIIHPNDFAFLKVCCINAAWCMSFFGIHPTLTHVPPISHFVPDNKFIQNFKLFHNII